MFRTSSRPSAARSLFARTSFALLLVLTTLGLVAKPAAAQVSKASSATINDYADSQNGQGYLTYGVVQAPDGNFYAGSYAETNIIRIIPATATTGTIGTLAGQLPSACGSGINGNILVGADGNLYGSTANGGTGSEGVFFKYTIATRTCTPVYNFTSSDGSGSNFKGWTFGSDGNYYGIYETGGTNGAGCIIQLTPAGKLSIVYNFMSTTDGGYPLSPILQATDGNWYGTTSQGGSGANQGVFYQLVPGATFPWVENFLYNISCTNGCSQFGPMVEGTDGLLYGTFDGGAVEGEGSIFQFDFQGDYSEFFDFWDAPGTALGNPQSGLFVGGDGNMYGDTYNGSPSNQGGFYQIVPSKGTFTTLGALPASPGIADPTGPVLQASDGNFYGGSDNGGAKGYGGLFQAVVTGPAIPAPIKVTLSSTTSNGSPVTVSWQVLNATSETYRNCYLYTQSGGGTFTGKATGTQSGSKLSGSSSVTPTATGSYTYAVVCAGTEAGISPTLTVSGISSFSTKTVLTASSTAITLGQSDTFTATVTRTNGSGIPGGTVTFGCCGLTFATKTLNSSGVATYTASSSGEPLGTYPIQATYTPDSDDLASTSNTVDVSLKEATATTVSVTPTTITEPGNATITVTVTQTTGKAGGIPTGSVDVIASGDQVISNYPIKNGTATIVASTKGFPKGTFSVTAKYNGSTTEATSTSTAQSVTLQ